ISYYEIGYKTGLMAAEILTGASNIATMAIAYDQNPVKKYNKENCEFFGLTVPAGYEEIK
ncbi:MAG: ABC transporter substrate-binding protein, partial [Clostridia bacterium]|nr:ABC transporter substrate-binding protein [Clostridia bacterium]